MVIETTIVTKIIYDTETKLSKVVECTTEEKDYSDNPEFRPVVVTKKQKKERISTDPKKAIDSTKPYIVYENNSTLQFNEVALQYTGFSPGDVLKVKYETTSKGVTYPIIAKAETFGVKLGNKLTKKGSMSYKGKQGIKLAEYGTIFLLQGYADAGVYRMLGNVEKDVPVQIVIPAEKVKEEVIDVPKNQFMEDMKELEDSTPNSDDLTPEDIDFGEEDLDISNDNPNSSLINFPEEPIVKDSLVSDEDIFDLDNLEI